MIHAGFMDLLVDLGQLPEFWANFGKDFPTHPALLDGSFTHVPITLYGRSLKFQQLKREVRESEFFALGSGP